VLGLAFSVAVFAGRTSVAAAKVDEGVGGSRYVSTEGWSGLVDMESGIPLSAGIPHGDEQFIDEGIQVIPYLSHGILSEAEADAAAARSAEAIHDPYLTDVFVRPGESLGGPDGRQAENWTVVPYLSHGILSEQDAQMAAAESIGDPNLSRFDATSLGRVDGDQVAVANALADRYAPGVTDFPSVRLETPATRPDDVADRFAHSDVPARPEVASSGGSTIEWEQALTVGIGAFALVLGLGLAFGYLKRPRLAGT
ncbi:MAG: hypothetical protein HOQ03_00325, partial [Thermoleophilia bacterium]|nr:hypothetical protein [Thermoleophilia bacterium]